SATDVAGVTAGGLGNKDIKPERTNESEVGLDAELWNRRLTLTFTYYDKLSHDALIAVPLPPSCGCGLPPGALNAGTRLENLGSVSNKGVEFGANVQVLNTAGVAVSLNASAFGVRSRVVTLGANTQPIIFGL